MKNKEEKLKDIRNQYIQHSTGFGGYSDPTGYSMMSTTDVSPESRWNPEDNNGLSFTDYLKIVRDVKFTPEEKKFWGGIATDLVGSVKDIYRMGVDIFDPPKTVREERDRRKYRQSREDALYDFYSNVLGPNVVEYEKEYGLNVAKVKDPDDWVLDVGADISKFLIGFKGLDKLTKFKKISKAKTKQGRRARREVDEIFKSKSNNSFFNAKNIIMGEGAAQLAFDPMDGALIDFIGMAIPEDDIMLGDLKAYLEGGPQERSRLENRMILLSEGLAVIGLMGGGIKFATSIDNETKFSKSFLNWLDKMSTGGQKTINELIKRVSNVSSQKSKDMKTIARKDRQKEIDAGNVKDMGDIDAFKSGLDKRGINLEFSSNEYIRRLVNIKNKLFSTKGGKTRKLQEAYLKNQNIKESMKGTADHLAYNLETAIKKIIKATGKDNNLRKLVDEVLFPSKIDKRFNAEKAFNKRLARLPEELQGPVKDAREFQDKISRLVAETDYLTNAQKKVFNDNLYSYVRRSYKIYEDSNYRPTKKIVAETRKFIEEKLISKRVRKKLLETPEGQAELRSLIDTKYNELLDVRNVDGFGSNLDKFEQVRTQILKGRKDIPVEIRKLWGEIDDPVNKLVHSTYKLSKMLADAKFYDEAYDLGVGIYFKNRKKDIFTYQIPEGYGKLSGKYTSKEVHQYFSNHKTWAQLTLSKPVVGDIYAAALRLKGFSQAAKTVWSHATHFKNIIGGAWMSLANGVNIFNSKVLMQSLKTLNARTSNNRELQKFHAELTELGILNKGVIARDLKGLVEDLNRQPSTAKKITDWIADKTSPEWLSENLLVKGAGKAVEAGSSGVKKIQKLGELAQKTYVKEDDFFKINMYIHELDNLTKINALKPRRLQLSTKELKVEAARIVRDTLPNYDLVPEFWKQVRSVPITGRFFSFMSESVRISYGTIMKARKDFLLHKKYKDLANNTKNLDDKEKLNKLAEKYLADSTKRAAAFSVAGVAGGDIIQNSSIAMSGLDESEVEAIKDFLPDYMGNSNIHVSVQKDGTTTIGNTSSWDPYDYPKKFFQVPYNMIFYNSISNEDFGIELLQNILQETVSPFLGESIIFSPIQDYLSHGTTDRGSPMRWEGWDGVTHTYDKELGMLHGDNLGILLGNLMEPLVPGTLVRAADYWENFGKERTEFNQNIYATDELVKFITGWGSMPMNKEALETSFKFKTNNFRRRKSYLRGNLYDGISISNGLLDYDAFMEKYKKANIKYYKDFAKFHKVNQSAEILGLKTRRLLKDSNISEDDRKSFRRDRFEPLGMTDELLEALRTKARESTDKDLIAKNNRIITNIKRVVNELDREFSSFPVLYSPENYIKQKEDLEESKENLEELIEKRNDIIKKELEEDEKKRRENLRTGGLVPNVKEDPADRVDPITGMPYIEQMDRLGFSEGGESDKYYGYGQLHKGSQFNTIARDKPDPSIQESLKNMGEGTMQLLFGDPRPDSKTPTLSRMTDEWTDYINFIPAIPAVGAGIKGGLKISKEIVDKAKFPKKGFHYSDDVDIKQLKSKKKLVEEGKVNFRDNTPYIQQGIFLENTGAGVTRYMGNRQMRGGIYEIDTSNYSSALNMLNIGKNKILDLKNPPSDFINKLSKDMINNKELEYLHKVLLANKRGDKSLSYMTTMDEVTANYLKNNNFKAVVQPTVISDGSEVASKTMILLEDALNLKSMRPITKNPDNLKEVISDGAKVLFNK